MMIYEQRTIMVIIVIMPSCVLRKYEHIINININIDIKIDINIDINDINIGISIDINIDIHIDIDIDMILILILIMCSYFLNTQDGIVHIIIMVVRCSFVDHHHYHYACPDHLAYGSLKGAQTIHSFTHQIQPEYGDERADAGRDCRTRLARPNSQARTGTGKYSFSLFS